MHTTMNLLIMSSIHCLNVESTPPVAVLIVFVPLKFLQHHLAKGVSYNTLHLLSHEARKRWGLNFSWLILSWQPQTVDQLNTGKMVKYEVNKTVFSSFMWKAHVYIPFVVHCCLFLGLNYLWFCFSLACRYLELLIRFNFIFSLSYFYLISISSSSGYAYYYGSAST